MEELNIVRPSPLRVNGPVKSTLSGRSTPRGSPRRLNSGRTPRRDGKIGAFSTQWFRSNRTVLWLLLITLWAYGGFYVQSRWAHGDNKEGIFGGSGGDVSNGTTKPEEKIQRKLAVTEDSLAIKAPSNKTEANSMDLDVVLAKQRKSLKSDKVASSKKKSKKSTRASRKKARGKKKVVAELKNDDVEVEEEEIPKRNTTYGLLVGPFGTIEDKILEWSPEKRSGTCNRRSQFARLVWSRKFVLILHELSMTGAPLAMLELATELLSCGATVYVVPLSKRGGLMSELSRRKIKVLEEKSDLSFKTAMKADLIIAGSAVCASWIEQYAARTALGSGQIAWWIMENRREYFDRAKLAFNRVKKLIFLSESQSKRWLAWCEEEHIKLKTQPALVPLSISDELAFVAGIPCSLSTPLFSPEKMLEKRQLLRNFVRKEMGLTDNEMLVVSLSSINPGKGQFLLLESTRLLIEGGPLLNGSSVKNQDAHTRALLHDWKQFGELENESSTLANNLKRKVLQHPLHFTKGVNYAAGIEKDSRTRKLFSLTEGNQGEKLKILIGSVGSKSNKVPYVKALLNFLSQHSNLSNTVLWTPSTTRVAALYAAADAYVMNSQGLGETFGRVTIEAMAFGLPVLGTDAGGTKEIIEHNVTGLLHPLGRPGAQVLAQNLQFLLKNPSERQRMGSNGRKKVKEMYLKKHMYQKFGELLYDCMRIK